MAHVEGRECTAVGAYSHAQGLRCQSLGEGSHAEGEDNRAEGLASHVEGSLCVAAGDNSHVEGGSCRTDSFANGAHAEGTQTQALKSSAHSEGIRTVADGIGSHAGGIESAADFDGQFARACGCFETQLNGFGKIGSGTAQFSIYHTSLQTLTTNADQELTTIIGGASGTSIVMPDHTCWAVTATLVGIDVNGSIPTVFSYYTFTAYFYRVNTIPSDPAILVGTPINTFYINSAGTASINTSTSTLGAIAIFVNPNVLNTRWNATFQITSVSF